MSEDVAKTYLWCLNIGVAPLIAATVADRFGLISGALHGITLAFFIFMILTAPPWIILIDSIERDRPQPKPGPPYDSTKQIIVDAKAWTGR